MSSRVSSPILAAGAAVWREKKDGIQVLLVYRPRYDDWSIPKGKLDPGEAFVAAAVREVEEETGYRIRLHRPLPNVEYVHNGRTKIVRYWVGTVLSRSGPGPQDRREVDQVEWVPLDDAIARVTSSSDANVLKAMRKNLKAGELDTSSIIVQRHGAAQARSKWRKGDENGRPLRRKGVKQAKALPPLVAAYAPATVVTSPWRRCLDTVAPYALAGGMDIVKKPELTEHAHRDRPSQAAAVMERVIDAAKPTIVCTHRPVLPTIIARAKSAASSAAAKKLPRTNPYLAAGEMLVLHTTQDGTIVDVERHLPNIG